MKAYDFDNDFNLILMRESSYSIDNQIDEPYESTVLFLDQEHLITLWIVGAK